MQAIWLSFGMRTSQIPEADNVIQFSWEVSIITNCLHQLSFLYDSFRLFKYIDSPTVFATAEILLPASDLLLRSEMGDVAPPHRSYAESSEVGSYLGIMIPFRYDELSERCSACNARKLCNEFGGWSREAFHTRYEW
jgi:hypothetical protein